MREGKCCCVVVLQNCVGFVEGETGSCNETDVECDVDGTEEFSIETEESLHIKEEVTIKVEDAIDIKVETPEFITFPAIKTEQEVVTNLNKFFFLLLCSCI